jgi:hypothetical protein
VCSHQPWQNQDHPQLYAAFGLHPVMLLMPCISSARVHEIPLLCSS